MFFVDTQFNILLLALIYKYLVFSVNYSFPHLLSSISNLNVYPDGLNGATFIFNRFIAGVLLGGGELLDVISKRSQHTNISCRSGGNPSLYAGLERYLVELDDNLYDNFL